MTMAGPSRLKAVQTMSMAGSDVTILAVGPAHYGLVAALHGLCFDDAWNADTVTQVMNMTGAFGYTAQIRAREGAPAGNGASGAVTPEPAGFVLCNLVADDCELLSLGVVPSNRGYGIGTRLVEAAVDKARTTGAKRLFLEVAEDNDTARWLYADHGFVPVGRRPGYYKRHRAAAVAALTLRLDLTG